MIQQKQLTSNNTKSKPLTNSVKFQKLNSQQNSLNKQFSKTSLSHVASQSHFKRSNNSPIKKMFDGNKNSSFMTLENQYLIKGNRNANQGGSKDYILQQLNDSYSIGGHSKNTLQTDQYYKYWKSKAHEYLDQNFKLREQNKKIKEENEQLRSKKNKEIIKIIQKQVIPKIENTQKQVLKKQTPFQHLEIMFQDKIKELQKDIASKNIIINQLQNKVMELNKKILGQQERTNLQNRLGQQVQILSNQNISLKKKLVVLQNLKQENKKQTKNVKELIDQKTPIDKSKRTYQDVRKKYEQNFKHN